MRSSEQACNHIVEMGVPNQDGKTSLRPPKCRVLELLFPPMIAHEDRLAGPPLLLRTLLWRISDTNCSLRDALGALCVGCHSTGPSSGPCLLCHLLDRTWVVPPTTVPTFKDAPQAPRSTVKLLEELVGLTGKTRRALSSISSVLMNGIKSKEDAFAVDPADRVTKGTAGNAALAELTRERWQRLHTAVGSEVFAWLVSCCVVAVPFEAEGGQPDELCWLQCAGPPLNDRLIPAEGGAPNGLNSRVAVPVEKSNAPSHARRMLLRSLSKVKKKRYTRRSTKRRPRTGEGRDTPDLTLSLPYIPRSGADKVMLRRPEAWHRARRPQKRRDSPKHESSVFGRLIQENIPKLVIMYCEQFRAKPGLPRSHLLSRLPKSVAGGQALARIIFDKDYLPLRPSRSLIEERLVRQDRTSSVRKRHRPWIPHLVALLHRQARCPYSFLLKSHCPTTSTKNTQALAKPIAPSRVVAFIHAAIKSIVPPVLLGKTFRRAFMLRVEQLIKLHRFEKLTLHEALQHASIKELPWGTNGSGRDIQRALQSDATRWMWFLLAQIVVPLLRVHFYATEAESERYMVVFYRKVDWARMHANALASMSDKKNPEHVLERIHD